MAFVLADLEDRHDAGMIELRGRLGLGAEALHIGVVGELTCEDHLQGDGAIERFLPRLVDDAHAAAADFFEQVVVAEVLDLRAGAGCAVEPHRRRINIGPKRRGDAHDLALGGEIMGQLVGEVGVPCDEFIAIRCMSAFFGLQIAGDDLVEQAFAFGVHLALAMRSWRLSFRVDPKDLFPSGSNRVKPGHFFNRH